MLSLIKKVINIFKGLPNFNLQKPVIFGDWEVHITNNSTLKVFYKKQLILANLEFQGVHFYQKNHDHKIGGQQFLNFKYQIQKSHKQLFLMFQYQHPNFQLQGSITITFKKASLVIEHRYHANMLTKVKIANILVFEQNFLPKDNFKSLVNSTLKLKLGLESTQEQFLNRNGAIVNLPIILDTQKGHKRLVVKSNNRSYETFKLTIGGIDEKI